MGNENKEDINTSQLPQSETFTHKEIFQHKQPADTGKAIEPEDEKKNPVTSSNSKEEEKTSKEEGLNEQRSAGNAGAFEGFEDQQNGAL